LNYTNPILPGFHPDPSICRVGEDYYLITSMFEYFPGLPIYHSKDLQHWEPIGHAIDRSEQLTLSNFLPNGFGLYAPTIRHHNGRFYIVCTNVTDKSVDNGNFIIWTDDIYGDWSDPIWIDQPGIDPSLFFDDDGKVYYQGTHQTIYACEIDVETGKTGPRVDIWEGIGAADPEGPHIYKKDGTYYLVIAEGGTAFGHMVTMAKSDHIFGPYESNPNNPVLTNRSLQNPIQAVGHADFFEDHLGNWWTVCLGIRTTGFFSPKHLLGRETFLAPVYWEDTWPTVGVDGHINIEMSVDRDIASVPVLKSRQTTFKDKLGLEWNYLYKDNPEYIFIKDNALHLIGTKENLNSKNNTTWIGRRQEQYSFTVEATFNFTSLANDEEFGLSIYLNRDHHYDIGVKYSQKPVVFAKQTVGKMTYTENTDLTVEQSVTLKIQGNNENYTFYLVSKNEELLIDTAPISYLTTESGGLFTGPYLALYATGNGHPMQDSVTCTQFVYEDTQA